jgi:hypothetical protein
MFYGVGEQGKTAVFRHLNELMLKLSEQRKEAQTQVLARSTINFEGGYGKYPNPAEALLKIAWNSSSVVSSLVHTSILPLPVTSLSLVKVPTLEKPTQSFFGVRKS